MNRLNESPPLVYPCVLASLDGDVQPDSRVQIVESRFDQGHKSSESRFLEGTKKKEHA